MSRFVTLVWLALRELWISFRLLLMLVAILPAALPAVLLPHALTPNLEGAPPDPLAWLAISLAAAMSIVAGTAAATLAGERRRGTVGWLAARSVPRAAILLAWFCAFVLTLAAGLVAVGVASWVAMGGEAVLVAGLWPFVATLAAIGCAGAVVIGLGLLLGVLLPPPAAGPLAMVLSAAPLLGAAFGVVGPAVLPSGGLAQLATFDQAARPIADALRASGAALALTATLLLVALAALERADL